MNTEILIISQPGEEDLGFSITASDVGLVAIDSLDTIPETHVIRQGESAKHPIIEQTVRELREYFAGTRKEFEVPIDLRQGTAFQREVWDELKRIPYGQTISYGEQAVRLGRPKAFRAVGGANGKNPIPIVIPCHRVLSSAGKLNGFSAGLDLKRRLLAVEGLNVPD